MSQKAWLTDTEPSAKFPVFTRLNAADVMADPITPLGASMCWIPNVLPGWASGYVEDVCFTADELTDESSVAGFFYGYLYVNQSSVRVLGIRKGMTAEIIDSIFFNSPGAPPHIASPSDQNEALSALGAARAGWVLSTSKFEGADEDAAIADDLRRNRPNLKAMSNRALVARARSVMPYERLAWRSEQIGSSNAAVGPAVAGQMLGADKAHLLVTILGYAGDVESAAPTYALWSLSRTVKGSPEMTALFDSGVDNVVAQLPTATGGFWSEFAAFIGEFGYRGPSEWDLGTESWESKPSLALSLVDKMRQLDDSESPSAKQASHAAATDKAMLEATEGMDAATEAVFRGAIGSARRFAGWRESGKSSCIKVMNEARMALIELGSRLEAEGVLDHSRQIFIALDSELDALALGETTLLPTIRQRETDWNGLKDLEVPTFLDGSKPIPPISEVPRKGASTRGARDGRRRLQRCRRLAGRRRGTRPRRPRHGRDRRVRAGRDPRRAADGPVVDAAVHGRLGGRRQHRLDGLARDDRRARARHPLRRRPARRDADVQVRRPAPGRRRQGHHRGARDRLAS